VHSCSNSRTEWKPKEKIQWNARQMIIAIRPAKEFVRENKGDKQPKAPKIRWDHWKSHENREIEWVTDTVRRWTRGVTTTRMLTRKTVGNLAYYMWRNSDKNKTPQYNWGCPVPSVNVTWFSWLDRSYTHGLDAILQRSLSKFRSLPDVHFPWVGNYVTNAVISWNIGGWWRSMRCAYHNTSASPNRS